MPSGGKPLSAEQIALIKQWIDDGAAWPDDGSEKNSAGSHWSFQPIGDPKPPALGDPWAASPIDAFILAGLKEQKLARSGEADRVALIRRLYLDLHGLLPTPAQVEAFVGDTQGDAWQRLVDQALASPRYGERWAQHWLDIIQYADSHGFEMNNPRPNAYHYRDYVIDAFNKDLPYDRFIFEQLAGDTVGADAATGFLVAGPWDQVKTPDLAATALQRQDELAAMVNTTGTALLGLTLGCARCHNHRYDRILQRDFYSLTAVFAGVRHGERPLKPDESNRLLRQLDDVAQKIKVVRTKLAPHARNDYRRTIVIDDEQAILLRKVKGHGIHPEGTKRGFKDDPGDHDRSPNVSNGRYSWWTNEPGVTLAAYHPNGEGRFRIWLSWGCGWKTHTRDARYILDLDGDPKTIEDQTTIATVDQQRFADGSGGPVGQSLWSGFLDAAVHELNNDSAILLQAGSTGSAVTADTILLQGPQAEPLPRFRPAVIPSHNEERFNPVRARSIRMRIFATNNGFEPCIDELEVWSGATNVARTATPRSSGNYQGNPKHRLEHINDGEIGNARSWISDEPGRGWIQLDLKETVLIDRVSWGRDRTEKYRDRTPVDYVIEVAETPDHWTAVAGSQDRLPMRIPGGGYDDSPETRELVARLAALEQRQRDLKAVTSPRVYAGALNKPGATHRLYRGEPTAKREAVAPDTLSALGTLNLAMNAPEKERRAALARWITDPANPLTARVMANRIWHHHFGAGIVSTPGDFGGNGAAPSHPELLDWLARQLMRSGWSIKKLHRLILLSNTYRQSSRPNADALARDAGARWLWRFPPRRLEAEAIRDCILQVSGSLDLKMGGPGFSTFKPNTNYVRVYEPKEKTGPPEWRRMIYMHKVRMEREPVFGSFDRPDAGQVCPKRSRSTTAIQALNLFNSNFVMEQAKRMAADLQKEEGNPVQLAYRRAYGRSPSGAEARAATAFVRKQSLVSFCRAILNSNELVFMP